MAPVTSLSTTPRYELSRTYDWNYEHAPNVVQTEVPAVSGDWQFCGLPVASPLGVPAGPLLNGQWCLYYASLGFDVLTYKTVRSDERACYPRPNLQPVSCDTLRGDEAELAVSTAMLGSWAVSFGMPSKSPDVWRADVEQTRRALPLEKILVVSVVGTDQEGWTIRELAADYARCARWAIESGADVVEANFSCPNVATCDGQLFQHPDDAHIVASSIRDQIGDAPFVVKIGRLMDPNNALRLLDALEHTVDGIAMTNSIATTVRADDGTLLFEGVKRGICGDAIRTASVEQTRVMAGLIHERDLQVQIIGVGGARTAEHVADYLDAGAHAVQIGTAAMVNPAVGIEIRQGLASTSL